MVSGAVIKKNFRLSGNTEKIMLINLCSRIKKKRKADVRSKWKTWQKSMKWISAKMSSATFVSQLAQSICSTIRYGVRLLLTRSYSLLRPKIVNRNHLPYKIKELKVIWKRSSVISSWSVRLVNILTKIDWIFLAIT